MPPVKNVTKLADYFGRSTGRFVNRTGATLYRGQIAMLDLRKTQAESTNLTPGDSASGLGNLTPCVQTDLNNGIPCVVALEDISDNVEGTCLIYGFAEIMCLDDDVSTTDADFGDGIGVLVAESATAAQAYVTGGRYMGTWLDEAAAATDASATQFDASSHRRWGLWMGGIPGHGVGL